MDYTSASGYMTDGQGRRQYVDRNDANGVQGTYLLAKDRNALTNEVVYAITYFGLVPSAADETQLAQAIAGATGNVQGNLNSEVVARANADAGLQSQINARVSTRPSDDGVNSPVSYLAFFDGNGVPWMSVAKSSGSFSTSLVQTNPGSGFYEVVNLTLNAGGQPIYVSSGGGTTQGITTFSDDNTTPITQAGYQHTNDYLSFNASGSWILGATQSWTAGQIANEATARANTDAGLQSQINVRVSTNATDDGINSPVTALRYGDSPGVPWLSVARSTGGINTSLVQTNPGSGFYQVTNLTLNAAGQPIYVSSGGGTTQGITTFSDANTNFVTQIGYQHTNDYLSFNTSGSWILGATQSWTAGQIANEATARANTDAGLQSQINVRVSTNATDDGTNAPITALFYYKGTGQPWMSVAETSGPINVNLVPSKPGSGFYLCSNLTLNAQGQPIYVSSGGGTTQGITTFSDANTTMIAQAGYQHTNDYLSFNASGTWILGATQSWTAGQIASEATTRANTDAGLQSQINARVTSSIGSIGASGSILGGMWTRHGNILRQDFRVIAKFGDVVPFPLAFSAGTPTVMLTAQAYNGQATTANLSGDPSLTGFTFISSYWQNNTENNSGDLTLHVSATGWVN